MAVFLKLVRRGRQQPKDGVIEISLEDGRTDPCKAVACGAGTLVKVRRECIAKARPCRICVLRSTDFMLPVG